MNRLGVALLVALTLTACGGELDGKTPEGMASAFARAGLSPPDPDHGFDYVKGVCESGSDDLVDTAHMAAMPGSEAIDRALRVGLEYACPTRAAEYAGIVERYHEMVGN